MLAAVLLALASPPVPAAELGPARLRSALGEPLRAEIAVRGGVEPGTVVEVPGYWEQVRLGMPEPITGRGIDARLDSAPSGGVMVTLTSVAAVWEPALRFLVRVRWPGGERVAAYDLILDRPPPAARTPDVAPGAALPPEIARAVARASGIERWTVRGRLAVRSADKAGNARLHWQQHGERYRIRLGGPFGQVLMELEGVPGRVELRMDRDAVQVASRPEELLARAVGWTVPLSGLRYWMLGSSEPGVAVDAFALDDAGRLRRLSQSGWRVAYLDYGDVGGTALPTRLELSNRQLEVKMIVSRWSL